MLFVIQVCLNDLFLHAYVFDIMIKQVWFDMFYVV